jgi:DNA-binding beta-propeller fold protein YncE
MDITSGTPIGEVEKEYDGMPIHQRMGGAELTVFVAPDVLETPSGIAFHQGIVLVTDNATGTIHVFDRDGTSLRTFTTGLPAAALGGITVGPDERVYVTNLATGQVLRVE